MIPERDVTISAADGVRLEARVAVPPGARAGVVCCHPHPLYGGDMDNPVVVRMAEVAAALGLATCRFNFRGVGRSTGEHGQGRTERLDAEAALDHIEAQVGAGAPGLLAATSEGSSWWPRPWPGPPRHRSMA
jgi:alpha/beta superfamily hydrolase